MQDEKPQSGAGPAGVPTELAERLLRRASEPLGVIDLGAARQMHSRGDQWLAQRFELAYAISNRYGISETTPPPVATPLARLGVRPKHEDVWSGLRSGAKSSAAAAVQADAGVTKGSEPPAEARSVVPAVTATPSDSQAPHTGSAPGRATESVSADATSPQAATELSLARAAEIKVESAAPTKLVQRKTSTAGAASSSMPASPSTAAPVREVDRSTPPTAQDLPLVKEQSPPVSMQSPSLTTMVHRKEASPLTPQRDIELSRAAAPPANPEIAAAVPKSSMPPVTAVVREVTTPAPRATMPLVMRRAEVHRPAATAASTALQTHTAPPVETIHSAPTQVMRVLGSTSETPDTVTGASRGSGVNVADIADRVSRLLARQFEVARERQGKLR